MFESKLPYNIEPRNSALDIVKTISVTLVAIFHYVAWNGIPGIISRSAYLCVDLLFIVTGYTTMLSLMRKTGTIEEYTCYLWKSRIFRLWIPYVIIYACVLLLYAIRDGIHSFLFRYTDFYTYFTVFFLLEGIGFLEGGELLGLNSTGVAWPLASEFWISLFIFPIIYKFRKRPLMILYCMLAVALVSMNLILINNNDYKYMDQHFSNCISINWLYIPIGAVRCILGLALGIIVYYARVTLEQKLSKIRSDNNYIFVRGGLTFAEIVIIFVLIFVYGRMNFVTRNTVVFPVLAAMLVLLFSLQNTQGAVTKVLNSRSLVWLGKLYFGVLMTHPFWMFLYKITYFQEHIRRGILIFVICTTISAVLFHFTAERLGKMLNTKFQK